MGKLGLNLISGAAAAIAFLSCLVAIAEGKKLETVQLEYGPFNATHFQIFEVERPATISNDALQVTPDTASLGIVNLFNNSGRILLKNRFKLWDGPPTTTTTRGRVASFNSSFLINIYRLQNETSGEGLAFLIAPDLLLPANSSGEFLGLTNSSTDGDRGNHLVAVELDTFKQDFDPDDNHIGIDLNSVRSIKTEALTPHNITLAPTGPRFYNVWVDYDGDRKVMDVYILEQMERTGPTPPKPAAPILSAADLDLRDYVSQYSYFGFAASTGRTTQQLNCVLRWNLTVHHFPEEGEGEWLKKIVLGAGVPVVVVAAAAAALGYYYWRRRTALSNPNFLVGALKSLPGTPREFDFRELKKATSGFHEKHKLGQGGFGVVYRGVLAKENKEIAVKWFSRESIKGQDDFLAELTIINRLRHKHLVKLLGWCHKNGKPLLVYEYMPNGSLDQHLFAGPNVEPLEWSLRYKIISGVASALHYLHNEYDQKVVHRDLKASNIMLDSNFNARLGDFGLARALDNEKTSYAEAEGVLGTMGYIAPECFHTGKGTQQSDVYAFGAVILEIVCGQRPGTKIAGFQVLVDWVWLLHRDGRLLEAVDQRLGDQYVVEEAQRLLLLGLACSHPDAMERPRTQAIVQSMGCCCDDDEEAPSPSLVVLPSGLLEPLNSAAAAITISSPMNSNFSALLCKDTLQTILEKLSLPDLARAACVSSLWRLVASDRDIQIRAFMSPWKLRNVIGKPSSAGFWRDNSISKFAVSHRISRSDSITSLAIKYSVQVMDIKRLNNMMSDHGIYSRERLLIPVSKPEILINSTCYIEVDTHAKREVAVLYLNGGPDGNLNCLLNRLITERDKKKVIDSLKRSMHVDDGTAQYYLSISNGDPRAALTQFSEDLRWERQVGFT